MNIERELFGLTPDGNSAYLFTLQNKNGVTVQVTNYGAKLVSAMVPDRDGRMDNIVLGYKHFDYYLKGHPYLGATIGRVTNRIGNGRFKLNGQTINLTKNLGKHHLHGGHVGFDSLLWDIVEFNKGVNPWVIFKLVSPNGDQGYPGTLTALVQYTLLQDDSLEIKMCAVTDATTVVNMTNHAYFNLNGSPSDDIYKHIVHFHASKYLKVDENSIPNGELQTVEGTVLDFTKPTEIGLGINQPVEPVLSTLGYDQFLVVDSHKKGCLNPIAEVYEPNSGRTLQVFSTLPGAQFYTSNFLDTIYPTNNGKIYGKHSAFCIEPSYFTDSPNHDNFQSIKLDAGGTYNETIIYKFLTR